MGKLTALMVAKTTRPGRYSDGDGLVLRIKKGGAKSWIFRYQARGREHWMGLGPAALVSLHDARAAALELRRQRFAGLDPLEARRAVHVQKQLEAAKAVTFKECADACIASHRAGGRNAKHADQWVKTIAQHASPVLGSLPIGAIDTAVVMRVLQPI